VTFQKICSRHGCQPFALSAVWAQSEPGLTDKTIKIGVFAPLSGNAMAYGFDVLNAAKMYYDKVNKEGGVHGRKIELVIEDDRCSANDLLAAVKNSPSKTRCSCSMAGLALPLWWARVSMSNARRFLM